MVFPKPDDPFDVTGVVAGNYNRLFALQQLLNRWRG